MTTGKSPFFISGGTLPLHATSYVERQADRDLLDSARQGDFCYVLNTRQMGKSSLMVRTAARLREEGFRVAILDLTGIGQNLSPDQWYNGLLLSLGMQLDLEDEIYDFSRSAQASEIGPMQRWLEALRQVVLPVLEERDARLVIFIDEIDAVRALPFPSDEFFAGIRECYNRRVQDPQFERLCFCLLGVATPSDLIRNPSMSPFNIGRRIVVTDFEPREAIPLAEGLPGKSQALRQILSWTGGHPYMTQRLCRASAESPGASIEELVDQLFLSRAARDSDDNLAFVRNRLLKSDTDRAAVLDIYQKVLVGERVADDELNPLIPVIKLTGIVREENGRLIVRNRIYANVFDVEWVTKHMPDAEIRRQRAAYRRGVLRAATVFSVIFLVITVLALFNYRNARLATAATELAHAETARANRLLYDSSINRAQQLYEANNVGRALGVLREIADDPALTSLRGFEWAYLYGVCHGESKSLRAMRSVSIGFTPSGDTLAAAGKQALCFWNGPFDQPPVMIDAPKGFEVTCGSLSPNGKLYAAGYSNGTVHLYDVSSKKLIKRLEATSPDKNGARSSSDVHCAVFSPDGHELLTAVDDGYARLWDLGTGKVRREFRADKGRVYTAAFSRDGSVIATGGSEPTCNIWDAKTGKILRMLEGHKWYIYTLAFSADGQTLASAGGDMNVLLWDWHTGKLKNTLQGHQSFIYGITFSPDGKQLASCSWDTTVRIWDTSRGTLNRVLRGHAAYVFCGAFSPDGKTLATGGHDSTVRLWNLSRSEGAKVVYQQPSPIAIPRLNPSLTTLLFSDLGQNHFAFDLKTGRPISIMAGLSNVAEAAYRESTNTVLGAELMPSPERRDDWPATGMVEWSLAKRRVSGRLNIPLSRFVISADGKLAAGSNGTTKALEIWDIDSQKRIHSLPTPEGQALWFAFSPDGRLLASASHMKTASMWDVKSGRRLFDLKGNEGIVKALAFSSDGKNILTGGLDRTARLWSAETGKQLAAFRGSSGNINNVAISPDGSRVVTAGADFTIKLWDRYSSRELLTLNGHTRDVGMAAFIRDGQEIISTGMDGRILSWRAPTKEQLAAWEDTDRQIVR